jgi:hypothetical protein
MQRRFCRRPARRTRVPWFSRMLVIARAATRRATWRRWPSGERRGIAVHILRLIGGRLPLHAVVQTQPVRTRHRCRHFLVVQDASIATISDDGVVTGVAPGTTQVSANVAGKSGLGTVTVQRARSRVSRSHRSPFSPAKPPAIGKNDNPHVDRGLQGCERQGHRSGARDVDRRVIPVSRRSRPKQARTAPP